MTIETLPVGPIGTNCYLLFDQPSGECAVIDPGADAPVILRALDALGARVRYLLLTHGHYDHTGAVAALLNALPPTAVYIHRQDFHTDYPELFPLEKDLESISFGGVNFYGEGDRLALGQEEIQVLATPGHSSGSVTLRCGSLLFCGDTLFAGSCGRTDLPSGSTRDILSSLARLGRLEGDFTVYPGHMEQTTLDRERQENPFLLQAMRQSQ